MNVEHVEIDPEERGHLAEPELEAWTELDLLADDRRERAMRPEHDEHRVDAPTSLGTDPEPLDDALDGALDLLRAGRHVRLLIPWDLGRCPLGSRREVAALLS